MNIVLESAIPAARINDDVVLSHDLPHSSVWDSFVKSHMHGSFYHLWAWQKLVSDVFAHRPLHIVARSRHGGEIKGILPLFLVRSLIFGRMLVSTPHAAYGGILANSDTVARAILQRAKEVARE